ncbi:MAG: hypothetical protein SPF15_00250 [Candidatus Cryptobacteroides sp.]|uniref:hypothetical protein n=1 Tax=Candidatus Cryptobacteroides sp. TaxID=2952915 RepID=UPI002A7EEBCE|nr:hypothetical protein [Candidatus Cryptobacteroides sp.]MDY5042424.1 hypothetical protein [Candidatus Cryptobacteroides sp.]
MNFSLPLVLMGMALALVGVALVLMGMALALMGMALVLVLVILMSFALVLVGMALALMLVSLMSFALVGVAFALALDLGLRLCTMYMRAVPAIVPGTFPLRNEADTHILAPIWLEVLKLSNMQKHRHFLSCHEGPRLSEELQPI